MSSLANGRTWMTAEPQEFVLAERMENSPCPLHQGWSNVELAVIVQRGSAMLRGHSAMARLRLCVARTLLPSCCLALRALRFGTESSVAAKGSIHNGASSSPDKLRGIGSGWVKGVGWAMGGGVR